jgi:putative ABC transport system substrate-binding protein
MRSVRGLLVLTVALVAALQWVPETWAQTTPRVGIVANLQSDPMFQVFEETLARHGWVNGKNVAFVYRITGGEIERISKATKDLVGLNVDVLCTFSAPATKAVASATRTIPIVAQDLTTDPIAAGYAESYARPGRNVTGVFLDAPDFAVKWVESLKNIVPNLSRVLVVWDPAPGTTHLDAVKNAAGSFSVAVQVLEVRTPEDIDRGFAALRGRPQAIIVLPSPMMYVNNSRIAQLALKHRLPATSIFREFAEAGGAIGYGPDQPAYVERVAEQVAKILAGAKPEELPIQRPSKFEFIVNLKTLKALGLSVPDSVLLRADEVIR